MGGRGSRGRALPQAGYGTGAKTAAEQAAASTESHTEADPPAAAPEPGKLAEPKTAADLIRDAYARLLGPGKSFVSLVDIRNELRNLPRAEVDAALRQFVDDNSAAVEPQPFGHRIGPKEREAAIHIGGEDRHLIEIYPPQQ